MSSRVFTASRKAQGFRDQAHLDAFYRYYDHTKTCANCGPGQQVAVDDGYQGTFAPCPVGRSLDLAR